MCLLHLVMVPISIVLSSRGGARRVLPLRLLLPIRASMSTSLLRLTIPSNGTIAACAGIPSPRI